MENDPLLDAVKRMSELPDDDKVSIRGKMYSEVHTRVQAFREAFGSNGRLISRVHHADEKRVMTETTASVFIDGQWRVLGNDFAEEYRGSTPVNKTSAVENCLTSGIGRCLANLALHGGNYASFEEVDNAINNKESAEEVTKEEKPGKEKVSAKKAAEEKPKAQFIKYENGDGEGEYAVDGHGRIVDEKFRSLHEGNLRSEKTVEGLESWAKRNDRFLKSLPDAEAKHFRQIYSDRAKVLNHGESK